ncbi:glycine cleavage system aminomethyltransferase GcvT [Oceanipulchritudo coccoides]|nr:glycine cleavage system aminomethyltransferase GcvT [Oceanipulchritudo coccoides]
MSDSLKRTPLHAFHTDHNARLVPFAGWEMPVQYTSILQEHRAVREAAGLFDVSHMGEVRVHGSGARAFLNKLVTNNVEKLQVGKAIYTVMCYEDGGVVDDLIIYQVGDEEYFLCVNAANVSKDVEWITGQAVGFDCLIDDVSEDFGQLALQGPKAMEIFKLASGQDLSSLKRFHFIQGSFMETNAIVSRTGYTGEDGVEIYLPAGEAARVANRILEIGKDHGLQLVGLGARDSLRLEAGYPLYGHEISAQIDPLTGGLGWVVKFQKATDFVGRTALQKRLDEGLDRKVVFFRLEDRRIAREGTEIIDEDGNPCGKVLSGTQSPMLGRPIGSACVSTQALKDKIPLLVEIRKTRIPLEIAQPPLHKV